MMKSTQARRHAGLARLALIPMASLLLLSLAEKDTAVLQDGRAADQVQEPMPIETASLFQDGLNSIEELKKYISRTIKYPLEARKSGHVGSVTLFARVSESGEIEEVLDQAPERRVIAIDEVVIVGYQNEESRPVNSSNRELLAEECERVIRSFPQLNIPDLQGQTLKFEFKFRIR